MIKSITLFILTIYVMGCNQSATVSQTDSFPGIQDSVHALMESISRDVTQNGPSAWLQYFENSPDFYMASEGILVFPSYDSAKVFVNNTLVKLINQIDLRWKNIRVDMIAKNFASVAANYHENKTNASGIKDSEDGYFTGLAHYQDGKWKLRNAHWSVLNLRNKQ